MYYSLRPPAVYAHESVVADPRCRARLDAVVAGLAGPVEVRVYRDEELPALIRDERLLAARVPMGALAAEGREVPDPVLLFNTFRFDGKRAERMERLKAGCGEIGGYHLAEALAGYGPFCWFDARQGDRVCRTCWRLHFQNGCVHKCSYCSLGGLLVTMVNVEEYIAHLDRLIEQNPWQETYLLEDDAEIVCLEPELGCAGPIIEHFGRLEGRYLVIHSKSANVDWMLDLEHNGKTIVVWSVSGPTQSRELEPVAGSTEERIEAARRLQDAGYTVRYKFKPIIPVRGWREEAAETVRMVFERTDPDIVTLCVFMWMDFDDMAGRLDLSLLDPEHVAAAEAAREEVAGSECRPFPPAVRAEIYEHHLREIRRHRQDVPVSLSTESWEMWKRFRGELGAGAADYVCGCGPNSVPRRGRLESSAFEVCKTGPVGGFESM